MYVIIITAVHDNVFGFRVRVECAHLRARDLRGKNILELHEYVPGHGMTRIQILAREYAETSSRQTVADVPLSNLSNNTCTVVNQTTNYRIN